MEALANLAHELRSPVQALLGYLDILRDEIGEVASDRHKQIIERMNANAHDLAQTVENVMDFSFKDAMAEAEDEEEIATARSDCRPRAGARSRQRLERPRNQVRSRSRARRFSLAAPADQVDTAQPRRQRDQVHRSRQRHHRDSRGRIISTRRRRGTRSSRHRARYRRRPGRSGVPDLRPTFTLEYPQSPRDGPWPRRRAAQCGSAGRKNVGQNRASAGLSLHRHDPNQRLRNSYIAWAPP